jgi:hypothetical protein
MSWFTKLLLVLIVMTGNLHAQLGVRLQLEKDFFLLYESISLVVSLQNNSGHSIQLESTNDEPWLTFLVNEQGGRSVPIVARLNAGQSVLIPTGQTVNRTVDLLPLYELRSRGNYNVQAGINANGITAASNSLKFTILEGRELWTQTVGLPSVTNDKDEYRVYTLLAHRTERDDRLYVSVKDKPPQVVYGVLSLGMFLPIFQPVAQMDQDAHLHVLFQNGPRSFAYVEVDPRAKIIQRAAFSDFMSRPHFVSEKGAVMIVGGEQIYPKMERILTDAETNPPSPPASPKKRTRWWWPFGKKEEPPFADELARPKK